MFNKNTAEIINKGIEAELEIAEKYGRTFNSFHEGYAVLLEEVEEVNSEAESLNLELKKMWDNVKSETSVQVNVDLLESYAKGLIAEAFQVCAVTEKIRRVGK